VLADASGIDCARLLAMLGSRTPATNDGSVGDAVSATERAFARTDLGAIERNCAHLRSLLADGSELCAVVKADG
jgi:hypothetical protein